MLWHGVTVRLPAFVVLVGEEAGGLTFHLLLGGRGLVIHRSRASARSAFHSSIDETGQNTRKRNAGGVGAGAVAQDRMGRRVEMEGQVSRKGWGI